MIKKFAVIKAVGRFKSSTMSGGLDTDLDKFAVIYGRNTKGKSTLTAILRSLMTNDPSIVIGRKTFSVVADQEIHIKMLDDTGVASSHHFSRQKWDTPNENLRIFDSKYVKDNVHVDGSINEDHQSNLEAIILGPGGKAHQVAVAAANDACNINTRRKAEITNEYNTHQKSKTNLTFDQFRNLNIDGDVQKKIEAKKLEIENYTKYNDIKTRLNALQDHVTNWNFEKYKARITPTLDANQEVVKEHIREHIANPSGATRFLYEGFEKLKGKNGPCVFCGQDISSPDALDLLDQYSRLFSQEYTNLNSDLKAISTETANFSVQNSTSALLGQLATLGHNIDVTDQLSAIQNEVAKFNDEMAVKISDLNYHFDLTLIDSVSRQIGLLKESLQKYVDEYRDEFDKEKLVTLNDELGHLYSVRTRSNEPWVELCIEYNTLQSGYSALVKARDEAIAQKTAYAQKMCTDYQSEINKVLELISADFRLIDVKTRESVRSRTPIYGIRFFENHDISLANTDTSTPCFENTLSESDKRLLAFAFFMAEVTQSPTREQLIVVLDDPMSSFDEDRKMATVKLLEKMQAGVHQTIVLTHEHTFLRLMTDYVSAFTSFKIVYDMANETSSIKLMDVNEEYLDGYYKSLDELKYLRTANDDELTPSKLMSLRTLIEHVQKKKYYHELSDDIRDNKSIGAFTKTLLEAGIYDQATADKINALKAHFWHHDDSEKTLNASDFTPGDMRTIIGEFFDVLKII